MLNTVFFYNKAILYQVIPEMFFSVGMCRDVAILQLQVLIYIRLVPVLAILRNKIHLDFSQVTESFLTCKNVFYLS